ncbi:MAG: hypothetical protein SWK76_09285 [Actinomycetota bacterium]|nr:hypothetical protein [Actinomycetota bacterium]
MTTLESIVKANLGGTTSTPHKSYFMKKLEQHLEVKGINIPGRILEVMDTPFEEFPSSYARIYKQQIKGQALLHIFSDMLIEIFQGMQADQAGWQASANFLENTPMRICAMRALDEIERLNALPKGNHSCMMEEFSDLVSKDEKPEKRKLDVKPYSGKSKSRWWKKRDSRN